MKTPSKSSIKTKKKGSVISPSMDLTRFGFSVKKRSASEMVSASSPATSKNGGANNAVQNIDEANNEAMESPLKRHKASPAAALVGTDIGIGTGGGGMVGKGKENGTAATSAENNKTTSATTAATRTALFDLTQSSSSDDGPSEKMDGIKVGSNCASAASDASEKMKVEAQSASLGGLASSIANQIMAASSHKNSYSDNDTQWQQQAVKQRRGKRDKDIPPQQHHQGAGAAVTKTIETQASAAMPKAMPNPPSKKNDLHNVKFHALALIRVIDPHEITCSIAVANARRQQHQQQQGNNKSGTKQQKHTWTPRLIFDGAILGRSTSSASNNANFVDLGIGNRCLGISRNHVTVLTVRLKSSDNIMTTKNEQKQPQHLSQTSAASSSDNSGSINNSHGDQQSTVTLQVSNNASNGVNIHRTKRGSRTTSFLAKGEKLTLRVGDALEFYSNEKFYYCVVGLPEEVLREMLVNGGEKNVGNVEKQHEELTLEDIKASGKVEKKSNDTKLNVADQGDAGNGNKQFIVDASKTSLITPRNNIDNETITSDVYSIKSSEEIEDTPRFPVAAVVASPMSRVKSATKKTAVANRLEDKKREKSPMGRKSPTRLDDATGDAEADRELLEGEENKMIKKGDTVKVLYHMEDMLGETRLEWLFGTVNRVKKKDKAKRSSSSSVLKFTIDVVFFNQETETLTFPSDDVEKIDRDLAECYPENFFVGDSVDCFFQNGKSGWHRGRIASISEDGSSCDILYSDGDYESNIPTKEKKIRLVKRVDMNDGYLLNKKTTIPVNESNNRCEYRTGLVKSSEGGRFCVKFSDGASESFDFGVVATGVFAYHLKDISSNSLWLWPFSSTASTADTARLRRQMKEKMTAIKDSISPKRNVTKRSADKGPVKGKVERLAKVKIEVVEALEEPIKKEIVRSVLDVNIDLDEVTDSQMKRGVRTVKRQKAGTGQWLGAVTVEGQHDESQDPDENTAGNKIKAKDFPPGLFNVIWCALNSPEPQTGANVLRNMLSVQKIVPPLHMVDKLMDLLKFGPKAEGSSLYFKDPLRTELASSYAYALVSASSILVRKDHSAIFGPSSWDDVEVLLSQSIDQTENAISGRRLAQGLHMAARGAQLLALMLKTELLENDLSSTCFSFDTASMKLKPTVKVLKAEGLRSGLKAVVRHTTKCLVRHSKWILDHDLNELSPIERASAGCCASEAKTCLDSLGSVVCYTAWLFCAEEGVGINHPNCAFVIKDEFLSELTRCIENLPEMNSRKKTTFMKRMKLHFLLSLGEEFAFPLQDSVCKMIGLDEVLDCM